jgi:hypothetical protein
VPVEPSAPLPAGVCRPPTPAGECPNYGIDAARVGERPGYSICGVEVTREQAHEALAGGPLVDDSDRWHLTAVGDAPFLKRFLGDVAALPTGTRSKLHVQTYAPTDWPVGLYKLPEGVSLRRPSPGRTAEQVGVVAVTDYSPGKLADLLASVTGVNPAPPPRPSLPAEPEVKPQPPAGPSPTPAAPHAVPDYPGLLALLLALVGLVASFFRRPA